MQATGNSFLIIEAAFSGEIPRDSQIRPLQVERLCSKHDGLGTDGLVLTGKDEEGMPSMVMLNSDGSRAELCGNALLCVARRMTSSHKELGKGSIHTDSGIKRVKVMRTCAYESEVEVEMGVAVFLDDKFTGKALEGVRVRDRTYYYASMGNPHAVCFVDHFDFDYQKEGKHVEHAMHFFPEKTNVEYVRLIGEDALEVRVWERGCGETLGCGTGACASYAVARMQKRLHAKKPAVVRLRGGTLGITWPNQNQPIRMQGTVRTLAEGVLCMQGKEELPFLFGCIPTSH